MRVGTKVGPVSVSGSTKGAGKGCGPVLGFFLVVGLIAWGLSALGIPGGVAVTVALTLVAFVFIVVGVSDAKSTKDKK